MKVIQGNIWDYYDKGNFIIIPTNADVNRDGFSVMGRGLALQAATRFPNLRKEYGDILKERGNYPYIFTAYRLITFPTKRSWKQPGDLEIIKRSVLELGNLLAKHPGIIPVMPRIGCGNARLTWAQVEPLLAPLEGKVIVVDYVGDQPKEEK